MFSRNRMKNRVKKKASKASKNAHKKQKSLYREKKYFVKTRAEIDALTPYEKKETLNICI